MRFFRRLREERGDIIVTPTIMILLGITVLLLGGATYVGSKAVGTKVNNTNQGLKIDEDGNVVEGAVGVIPVPKPTPKPESQTRVIDETVHQTAEPASQPQSGIGGVVAVNPGDSGNVSQGTSSTSNSSSSSSDNNSHTEEPSHTHDGGCNC